MPIPSDISTDILVVGAGPAGATAAQLLAAGGREVLLVEKESLPRYKPCAGGLPARAVRALGLDLSGLARTEVAAVALDGAWTGRQVYSVEHRGVVVDRAEFDQFLAEKAVAAGAILREKCAVKSIRREAGGFVAGTAAGAIKARVVCAADGVFSPTGRALGFPGNEGVGVALEALVAIDAGHDAEVRQRAIFSFGRVPQGYGWCFPRGEMFTIGVGTVLAKAPALRRWLADFARRTPELRGRELQRVRGGCLPNFNRPRPAYAESGAYLLGDAAGLVDPLTGEGIFYAVMSGRHAAAAILGGGEAEYEQRLRRDILPEMELARRYTDYFLRLPRWLIGGAMSSPRHRRYVKYFMDILGGVSSYREMHRAMRGGAPEA